MITLRQLTLARGSKLLLEGVDLTLHAGQKIGVVGPNGCGKSSLFALLLGELHQEAGDLELPGRLAVAHVAQDIPASEQAAIEFVIDGDAPLRALEQELGAGARHRTTASASPRCTKRSSTPAAMPRAAAPPA